MRGISSLIDTEMEESTHFVDENMLISSSSETELPKKKSVPAQPAGNRVIKPKSAPRKSKAVQGDGARKAVGKTAPTKRKALEEKVTGETKQPTKKSAETAVVQSEDELEGVPGGGVPQQEVMAKPKRKPKAKKDQVQPGDGTDQVPVAAKPTQIVSAIGPQSIVQELDNSAGANTTYSPQHVVKKNVRRTSRSRQENEIRRRAGSASDTERGGADPNLRRKLGDITRKFENIDLKYRSLKDVGILEANANMEKLRKQCDATTSASADLIASLKKELAMQMPLAQEARQLQADLQIVNAEAIRYRSSISDLESSLATAQNEIKALQARLAAARSSATLIESANAKTPGSVMKNGNQMRTLVVGSAEAAQAAQTAQLKEDLYSDLTGLIIRGVKRTEDGDTYDCIQTGRNGTLHFKLVVEAEGDGRPTTFEEAEFSYTPLLDANRDKSMIEVLPDYLKDDITFARHHAAKFYSRVVDALTRKESDE